METIAAMDVEEQPSPTPNNVKRFGLKNSIQTNFGEDYVFQIIPKDDWSAMAVSLSTNSVKLYSPVLGQYYGECKGHSATINQILFSGHSNDPNVLIWDRRYNKQIACLEDSHVDDVTQVHFVPGEPGKLISASVDGLICIFDTTGDIDDDDHLDSVINVGTSIARVGFFEENYQKLWCLTHIETLGIWDWKDGRNEVNFSDARTLASESWNLDHVDYFVDCHYSKEAEKLWLIGGTNAGTLGYFPVNYNGMATIGAAEAILEGGHTVAVVIVIAQAFLDGRVGKMEDYVVGCLMIPLKKINLGFQVH
ncbi:hypothetical protein TSUD_342030 [Trifolium subterraneum]|nr:hypothetical protein TSUD_342030 [Trifolium subterraneum]